MLSALPGICGNVGDQPLEPEAPPDPLALPTRAGRALIGWMTPEQGALTLAGRVNDGADEQQLLGQVEAARQAVAAREAGVAQDDLLQDVPPELAPFVTQLQAQENAAPFFHEGWEVKFADLSRVCSLQQQVLSEQASERVASVAPDDIVSIAEVTLPAPTETALPAQFDEVRNTWIIAAGNPNLKITGRFGGQLQPGAIGFGFLVGVMPSFVQVARHHGRYVLRDGYHRSYGLLARGITHAPVFVRDFGVGDLGVGPGLFPTDVYLGDRPPLLADFLDEAVAADVRVPTAQKMLVVQGLELTPLG